MRMKRMENIGDMIFLGAAVLFGALCLIGLVR